MGKKKGKGKEPKLELVFNEKDRRDYLTGFKKRKQERRETAAKKFDKRFKQEKNRIRQEKRSKLPTHGPTVLPDNMLISEDAEPAAVTHDLEKHTVSVTTISDLDLTAGGLFLGKNALPAASQDEEEEDQPEPEKDDEVLGMELKATPAPKAAEKPVSQRSRQNILETKARLQEKKNKQKSKNLQKHKARINKKHMKLSHQLKKQRRKGSAA
ncbi:nucleolar protein 12-like [Amphibalanus amphitrite]|uniref:nucleolar protein 12-like n=1 Tax=Amphibalanus amphitrite TaxID=1232801 RepID=UPI001C9180B5|nr:nucleolar protein 12-like [Amphibalanus amphitrite]